MLWFLYETERSQGETGPDPEEVGGGGGGIAWLATPFRTVHLKRN